MIRISILFVLLTALSFSAAKKYNHNVGTTLFSESDNVKKCWNRDEIALLASRKILQDILPSEEVINIGNEKYISHIIDYFRLILEVVRSIAYGKTKHIVLLALSDTLGGYMNEFLLPVTRFAYYCGSVSFDNVQKLYSLFNELKSFLKTNGATWTKADNSWASKRNVHLTPYHFKTPKNNSKACDNIIFYEHFGPPGHRTRDDDHTNVVVPLPFFDSKTNPTAIAIPFKTFALRNVETKGSAFILVKYYVAAKRCIVTKENSAQVLQVFDQQFNEWLHREVLPHLKDEKFYAAFGGVLRIVQNLKKSAGLNEEPPSQIGEYHIMPKLQKVYHNMSCGQAITTDTPDLEALVNTFPPPMNGQSSTGFIVFSLLIALFVWIILGTVYVCCRLICGRGRRRGKLSCDPRECKEVAKSKIRSMKAKQSKTGSLRSGESIRTDEIGECLCAEDNSATGSKRSSIGGTPTNAFFSTRSKRRASMSPRLSAIKSRKSDGHRHSAGSDMTTSLKSSTPCSFDPSVPSGEMSPKSIGLRSESGNRSPKSNDLTPKGGDQSPQSEEFSPQSDIISPASGSPKSGIYSPTSGDLSPKSGGRSPPSQMSQQSADKERKYSFKYELEDSTSSGEEGFTTDEEMAQNRSR